MFNSILVPLDRSALAECALPHALAAARSFDASLALLHVMDAAPHLSASASHAIQAMDWQLLHVEAERYLESIAQRLRVESANPALSIHLNVIEGTPAEAIEQHARSNGHSLIILSSYGQSSLSRMIMSSVTHRVALYAPASLLIVRAYHGTNYTQSSAHYKRILLPLDGSQRAECVLPVAIQVAKWHDAEIVLVHVVPRPEIPRHMPISLEEATLAATLTERNRAVCERYFDDLHARLSTTVNSHVIVNQHVDTALQDMVMHESPDLVIVSAHGYSGQSKWPLGNVARNLVEFGSTHVLVVQDDPLAPPALMSASQIETTPNAHAARQCS